MESTITTPVCLSRTHPHLCVRHGDLIFISGLPPFDEAFSRAVREAREQGRPVPPFPNPPRRAGAPGDGQHEKLVEAAGSNMDCLLKVIVWLRDQRDSEEFDRIYRTYFSGRETLPARTRIQAGRTRWTAVWKSRRSATCRGSSRTGPPGAQTQGALLVEKKIEQIRKNQPEERIMGKSFTRSVPGLRRSVSRSPVRPWRRTRRRSATWSSWVTTTSRVAAPTSRDPQAGQPLDRLCRAPRRQPAEPAYGQEGRQRHIDPRCDRSEAAQVLAHIPGEPGKRKTAGADGADVHRRGPAAADKSKAYLLRPLGNKAQEIWDVTDPSKPTLIKTIVDGLKGTHKSWWECDSGIAYLVVGLPDWRTGA